ncbi:MAG: polyprenyl synthetase family protein [Meiothermus sp.]|uniref:polyprenyl synthetase family protein n=1 Tax=Meiothermus sp. TaxID=1955249 RepID=UPI0025DC76D5|nr:polyprenyl synthetase family protein [Meiothermus sp.]MCS7193320.1 polyprenyl synthetase family protein [Meiothermus sp.]MDW8091214.1 polyprenyl synthetase family protein [Meiothermus sp.]MDW8482000.1 polyprenyl synthetase family protein [Meiothermus sp.]
MTALPTAAEVRQAIRDFLLSALPRPEAASRPELAEYARMLRDYPERGGKMLRGALLVYTGLAYGAAFERLLPVAAALELFQNWALIHDDIEDGSDERRGRPALHRLYGVPLALNVGDALHAMQWGLLVRAGVSPEVLLEFVRVVERTAQGQHLEIAWTEAQRFDLTEADYLEMVGLKAAYYTAVAPLRLGVLVAGGEPPEAFEEAGMRLGTGFQIVDDVLNLKGDPVRYGKEIGGDLWEGKRTLVLLHFLQNASPEERRRAERLLCLPRTQKPADEVAWLHHQLLSSGALAYAERMAEGLLEEGLARLKPLLQEVPQRAFGAQVVELLEGLVHREA